MKHRSTSQACRRAGSTHRPLFWEPAAPSASVPHLPLGPHDLQALEAVTRGYLGYLRKAGPASAKQQAQIRALQGIQARLAPLLAPGASLTVHIPLTREELTALQEAVRGFVTLLRQMVPPSEQRDGVIASLEHLHQALAGMLASKMPG
jgi:hypothetical protein